MALLTAVFFTGAMAIAGACSDKGSEDNKAVSTVDAFAGVGFDLPETGAERRMLPDGGLFLDPGGRDGLLVTQAVVTLAPINGGRVGGTIRLTETRDGVRAGLDLKDLTYMSKYTLRVHMLGNCSADDGTSAGPGFNFQGSSLEPETDPNATGMLGEIQGDLNGLAKGEAAIDGPAIRGPWSIVGRAIVLHAAPDGLSTDPSGKRIGCGVVGIFADVAAALTTDR